MLHQAIAGHWRWDQTRKPSIIPARYEENMNHLNSGLNQRPCEKAMSSFLFPKIPCQTNLTCLRFPFMTTQKRYHYYSSVPSLDKYLGWDIRDVTDVSNLSERCTNWMRWFSIDWTPIAMLAVGKLMRCLLLFQPVLLRLLFQSESCSYLCPQPCSCLTSHSRLWPVPKYRPGYCPVVTSGCASFTIVWEVLPE